MKREDIINAGIVIFIILILYKGVKIFDGVLDIFGGGSKGHAADAAVEGQENKDPKNNPFSGEYIKSLMARSPGKSFTFLTGAAKQKLIDEIEKRTGFFHDESGTFGYDPKIILSLLKQYVKHKTQMSDLANFWEQKNKSNMLVHIQDKLGSGNIMAQTDMSKLIKSIVDYVNSLPE